MTGASPDRKSLRRLVCHSLQRADIPLNNLHGSIYRYRSEHFIMARPRSIPDVSPAWTTSRS